MLLGSMGAFPRKEGGIQVLAGLLHLAKLLDPYREPPGRQSRPEKSAKCELSEFTSMENYSQPLLTERLRQSHKFDEVKFYLILGVDTRHTC